MKRIRCLYILCFICVCWSCEELIQVDLNEAHPRYVIEAQITDLAPQQQIRVSQSVAFHSSESSLPIENATVFIVDDRGRSYNFVHTEKGLYMHPNLTPVSGRNYRLQVMVDNEVFSSEHIMPEYVEVDSLGILEEKILNDYYYFATLKFTDPAEQENYYKYDISVNGSPFKFASVFSDKFNDGLYVTHQIADLDSDLQIGDSVVVRRYTIDKSVFSYWNEFQTTNPGSAAPSNPTSNISNHALGYFAVTPAKEYKLVIQ